MNLSPQGAMPAPAGTVGRPHRLPWSAALALPLIGAIVYALIRYPLPPAPLAAALAGYAVLLWCHPEVWLVVLPALIPTADLTPWTGWIYVQESDLFVAVTLALLLLRRPPTRADLAIGRGAAGVLAFAVATYLVSLALGFHHLADVPDVSDNPYLDTHNALRLAKGPAIALALLPFLGRAFRRRGDAFALLSWGMILGLLLVSAAALLERFVFVDIFDLGVRYRVVATFSGMRLGGGQIGAYLAMTLPFLAAGLDPGRHPRRSAAALMAACFGGFTLIITFSRTDAVAAAAAICVLAIGHAMAATAHQPRPALQRLIIIGSGGAVAVGLLAAAANTEFMRQRMTHVARDLVTREDNWASGFAVRETGPLAALFGSGLGSYPRIYAARNRDGLAPGTFTIGQQNGASFLTLRAGEPIYFGQKVAVRPHQKYQLSMMLRFAKASGDLNVFLCEKWLLYSLRCETDDIQPETPGRWEAYSAAVASGRLGDSGRGAWLPRPVELAFSLDPGQTPVDIRDVRLIDAAGRNLIANGSFAAGTERWLFTDDAHLSWRMHDQYLTTVFECGWLGLAAFLLLAGWTLVRAARGCGRGERDAAVIAAGVTAFLVSGIFDYVTEAPRLATLFYLLCFAGFWLDRATRQPPA